MNNMANVRAINEKELELGITGSASWHHKYRDSAWVYVGGLANELSEGDVVCVMSQWGEVEDFNMPRDGKTGKPRGWAWVKYEDQRSTILAVDNANGASLLKRTLRVDHCEKYKLPPELRDKEDQAAAGAGTLGQYGPSAATEEEEGKKRSKFAPGAVYAGKDLASKHSLHAGVDVFGLAAPQPPVPVPMMIAAASTKHNADGKKRRKNEDNEKTRKKRASDSDDDDDDDDHHRKRRKKDEAKKDASKKDKKKNKKKEKKKEDDKKEKGKDKAAKKKDLAVVDEADIGDVLPMPAKSPFFDALVAPAARDGEVAAPSWRGGREPGGAAVARQGEVVGPSWRGAREPGSQDASFARRSGDRAFGTGPAQQARGASTSLSWEERQKQRDRSFGGLLRKR